MTPTLTTLLFCTLILNAEQNPLDIFKPLQSHIWKAEGKWGIGLLFKQEIELSFSLNDKIVKVESKGFTDEKQTQFGMRSHGIRQYDEESGTIKFWKFDVFGSVTEGDVRDEGKNIFYEFGFYGTKVIDLNYYSVII